MISPEPEELGNFAFNDKHPRVIIHFDVDCFYAQVEMVRNPSLRDKPMGVQQQTLVVTSNYAARSRGVVKCMSVAEAKKVCPELILVNGEDVSPYREYAARITNLLREYSDKVEKLGFDENYIDVTEVINGKPDAENEGTISGCVFQDVCYSDIETCPCGCHTALIKGTKLAANIRERIFEEIGLTTCAGISWNKLVSKLIGPTHKPNNQTVIFPDQLQSLMESLSSVRQVPGIGHSTVEKLSAIGVVSVSDLQTCSLLDLEKVFDKQVANRLMRLSYGDDNSEVKTYERNKSIGVEDSCEPVTALSQCEAKLRKVLLRVAKLLTEDGRLPGSVKTSVRIFDKASGKTIRESRQASISSAVFRGKADNIMLDDVQAVLLKKCSELVYKMVEKQPSLYITLFGISFSKLTEVQSQTNGSRTLASFFAARGSKTSKPDSSASDKCLTKSGIPSLQNTDEAGLSACAVSGYFRDFTPSPCEVEGGEEVTLTAAPTSNGQLLERSQSEVIGTCSGFLGVNDDPTMVIDLSVLEQLPLDIKNEVLASYKSPQAVRVKSSPSINLCHCPRDCDPEVFESLPQDIKEEILSKRQQQEGVTPRPVKRQRSILDFLCK